MQVNVTVKSAFYHGNKPYAVGEKATFTKAEAHDLEKSGQVEVGSEVKEETETKMDAAPKNKMADAQVNKAAKKAD